MFKLKHLVRTDECTSQLKRKHLTACGGKKSKHCLLSRNRDRVIQVHPKTLVWTVMCWHYLTMYSSTLHKHYMGEKLGLLTEKHGNLSWANMLLSWLNELASHEMYAPSRVPTWDCLQQVRITRSWRLEINIVAQVFQMFAATQRDTERKMHFLILGGTVPLIWLVLKTVFKGHIKVLKVF